MEEGCSRFSAIKIGEKSIVGINEDMSAFKISINDWNLFHVKVKDKNAEIYINNQLIFSGSYELPNGRLVGIENVFKGSGLLDYIEIKDLNSENVFFDDFKNVN